VHLVGEKKQVECNTNNKGSNGKSDWMIYKADDVTQLSERWREEHGTKKETTKKETAKKEVSSGTYCAS
jgi:hypothetical protein